MVSAAFIMEGTSRETIPVHTDAYQDEETGILVAGYVA